MIKESIGIYKPGFKIKFGNDEDDLRAIYYEVVNVARIFAERGHSVFMLSDNDIDSSNGVKDYPNIYGSYGGNQKLERIILYSGPGITSELIKELKRSCDRLDFLWTDMRVGPSDKEDWELFDNIYTQATKPVLFKREKYGGVAEILCYNAKIKNIEESLKEKNIRYYFGGTERNRIEDYLEYVWRPDCKLTGKSETLGFNNRVPRSEYMKLLDNTKYSIVIADKEYNEKHFITPRHYENILHFIVSFVDYKFDKDEHLIKHTDWRRVKSYLELREKMKVLDESPSHLRRIIMNQRKEIKEEYINGDYVYKCLNK